MSNRTAKLKVYTVTWQDGKATVLAKSKTKAKQAVNLALRFNGHQDHVLKCKLTKR